MSRRLPILPTLVVLAAVAVMVALGMWQLRRADEKALAIARYESALTLSSELPFPRDAAEIGGSLYRRSVIACRAVRARGAIAGTSGGGEKGWAQTARCATDHGEVEVLLGWSRAPASPAWEGGRVAGIIVPSASGARLQAALPQAGLEPLAQPDPKDLPNNHMAYAGQWFFFAVSALAIYALALRKRLRSA